MAGEKNNKGRQSPGGPSGQNRQGKIGQARKQAVSQGKKATKVGAEGALASYTGGVSKAVLAVIPTPLDSPEDRRKKTRNRRIIYALVAAAGIAQVAILALVLSTIFTAVFGGGGNRPESPNTCLELDLQKGSGGGPDAPRGSGGTGAVAGELGYPVDPGTPMTSGFGPRWGTNHNGQDFGAPEGSSLYAMADGEVVKAGEASGFDHWAVIRHELSNGEMIDVVYGHMDVDTIFVKQGDKVRIGDEIGQIGVPGNSTPQDTPESTTGAHLHLEIHPGGWGPGNAVDPKPYLDQFQSEGAQADRPPEGDSPDRKASNQSGGDGGAERAGSAVEGSDVLLVGDSIGKRAEAALDSELPGIQVNARESRPFSEGADIIRGQIDDLPPVLVVELGTNGGLDADEYQGLVDEVHEKSPDTKVVAVNLWAERDWIDAGNKVIDGLNGVTVADWHSVAEDDPSLIDDGVHQTMQEGSTELARVIAEAVRSTAPEPSAAPRDDAAPAGDDEGGSDDSRAPPADTPPGTVTAADWEKLAECESGGKWDTNTGNGFFGGLQFTKQTWDGFGGGEYADMPNEATKEEQMEVANKILAEQGWGAWPSCTNNSHPELKGLKPAPEGSFVNGGGGGGDTKAAGSGGEDEESPADKLQSDLDRIVGEARDNGVTLAVSAGEVGADAINAGDSGGSVYAASTIKVAIAATVEKKLKQDDDVDVEDDDVVGGSGTDLEAGTYPVSELEEKMITASDNTATNALIDAVGGFDEVNKVIADAGVEGGYKLANKMMAEPSGQSSQISAESARTFLDALFDASENDGGVVAKDQASRIVDLMKQQNLRDKLPADIPEGDVANKTGETDEVSHDIGFVWPKSGEPVSVAVTSEFSSDIETANGYIADIGKAIYDGGAGTESGGSGSSAAAPYEPEGDQLTTTLGPEEQANVKAIITAAKRSDLEPPERAASLATMLAGYETQWISQTEEDHENEIGIFAEAPLGGVTASQLEDPEKSAKRFMDRLKDVAEENPNWATDPAADVLVAMYPSKAALQFDLPKWEEVSTSAVDELWDDENAQEGSRLERLADDVAQCSLGRTASSSGAALAPGEVPEEFVPWLDLAAGLCDGIDAPLLAAQIEAESGFQQHGANYANASGYTQFIPSTWNTYGFPVDENGEPTGPAGAGDPNVVGDAVMAQGHYMCDIQDDIRPGIEDGSIKGDITELSLAGYNAGAGAVINAGGMPSGGDYTTQTQPYVQKIMAAREKYAQKGSAPAGDDRAKKTSGGSKASDGDFSKGEKALKAARKQEGKPYVFGANGPDAWDCSSLTQQAYKEAGIDLPRTTYEQVKVGKEIPMSEAQPGDLIFSNYQGGQPEHVSMFVEDGRHYEAQTSGVPVGEHDMWASDMKVYRMY